MADIKPHVAKAVGSGRFVGGWSVGTAKDISSAAQVHITITRGTNILRIYTESDIYITFDNTSNSSNDTPNDMVLEQGRNDVPVPQELYAGEDVVSGSAKVIYCHAKQVTSVASKTLRYVES